VVPGNTTYDDFAVAPIGWRGAGFLDDRVRRQAAAFAADEGDDAVELASRNRPGFLGGAGVMDSPL